MSKQPLFGNIFNKINCDIKVINEAHDQNDKITKLIINEFFTKKHKKLLIDKKIKIIIPNNFNSTYYNYSNSVIKTFIDKNEFPDHVGICILPSDINATEFVIIIDKDTMSDIKESYKVLFHEFTHVIDYTNFFNHNGNIYISDIDTKISTYYFEFYLWTEFNAKRTGLARLKNENDKAGITTNLFQIAASFQQNIVTLSFESDRYYSLTHFLARISVYEHLGLNSLEFPENWLSLLFEINVQDLYDTLKETDTYEDFNNNKVLIRKLFKLKHQKNYLC
jgi:hypothetical protein